MNANKINATPPPESQAAAGERPPLSEYVCSGCFRSPGECICDDMLPGHLVVIDRGIQEHVRILNEKGYRTDYCCESHRPCDNLYVSFRIAPKPGAVPALPQGFKSRGRGRVVEHMYGRDSRARRRMTAENFEREKAEHLASFLEWCRSLPARGDSEGRESPRRPEIRCTARRGDTPEETLANYECAICGRKVTECEGGHCRWTGASLMDGGIRPHLDALDERGYSAESGCAGHGPGTDVFVKIWPYYRVQELLDEPPAGFVMRRDLEDVAVVHRIPEDLDGDAAETDRAAALERLLAWCEGLPERDCLW